MYTRTSCFIFIMVAFFYLSVHAQMIVKNSDNQKVLRITTDGNMGIGTSTPSHKLHVNGSLRVTGALIDGDNTAGGNGHILQSSGSNIYWVDPSGAGFGDTDWVEANNNVYRESGNVGVGTTAPDHKFTVEGDSRLYGTLFLERACHNDPIVSDMPAIYAGDDCGNELQEPGGLNIQTATTNGSMRFYVEGGVGEGEKPQLTIHPTSVVVWPGVDFQAANFHVHDYQVSISGGAEPPLEIRNRSNVPSIIFTGDNNKCTEGHDFAAFEFIDTYAYPIDPPDITIAKIRVTATEYYQTGHHGTSMSFMTRASNGGDLEDRLWLDMDGNVGIGTTSPQGKLDVNGSIYQRGGELHADYVFQPDYKLESIEEHAAYMWENSHLSAIPPRKTDANGLEVVEFGAHQRGIVEELEKAHIYIEQLHKRLENVEALLSRYEVEKH